MQKHVAFLRAINVGGRRIKMDELANHFIEMGYTGVKTFLASGNVIFDAQEQSARTPAQVEDHIQTELAARLGYPVTTFVRTDEEVAQIAAYTPFPLAQLEQSQALNVALLQSPLTPVQTEQLATLRTEIDDFHTHNREVYWLCRVKQSESKFSNAVLERALQLEATFRTINTFRRMKFEG